MDDQKELTKNVKITDLHFSTRVRNSLINANIETVEHLLNIPEYELLRLRNFGKKALREVRQTIRDMGLCLKGSLDTVCLERTSLSEIDNDISVISQNISNIHSEIMKLKTRIKALV